MRRVYVASPLSGDVERNTRLAKELCARALLCEGVAPFAPHIFYTAFLDDHDEYDRAIGMAAGQAYIDAADALWVYTKKGISPGMAEEIKIAHSLNIPIVFDPACWDSVAQDLAS